MACPRAFKRTKNAQDRQLQRKLSNVRSARAAKATARKIALMYLGIICAVHQSVQYLFTYYHSDPQYLYYKHVYPSHGQG